MSGNSQVCRSPLDRLVVVISTLGYAGYFPVASGTAGTAVAACLFWVLGGLAPLQHVCIALGVVVLGTWAADRAGRLFGEEDSGKIVIDEMAGFWITMLFHPATWRWIVAGFVLFRLFDVMKPFPVRYAERRFRGGWGVMLDDVLAGIYANGALYFVRWFSG